MIPTTCAARRRFLLAMSAAAASLSLPRPLRAAGLPADHTGDWTWLLGNWTSRTGVSSSAWPAPTTGKPSAARAPCG